MKSKTLSSLPSSTVSKRYLSKFKKEWSSDPKYSSFLKECKNDATKALCIVCNIQFSIQNSGITDVNNHTKTKKHQECLKSIESSKCSIFLTILIKNFSIILCFCFVAKTIDSIFNSTKSELNRLSATEGAFVFHGVKHSHSYLSQSCTTKLTKKCFSDSILAKNIACSKTKVGLFCLSIADFFYSLFRLGK
jgi:hypothetical protein